MVFISRYLFPLFKGIALHKERWAIKPPLPARERGGKPWRRRQSTFRRAWVRGANANVLYLFNIPLIQLKLSSLTLAKLSHPSPARGEGMEQR